MILGTTYILGDEKAIAYYEINLKSPNGSQHRYQIIHVVRNDKPAEYREDMGLTKNFRQPNGQAVMQTRIPSNMVHTVNELKEMAQQMRHEEFELRELVQADKIKT